MIGMAEYYIVIHEREIGFKVAELMHIWRQTRSIDSIGNGSYKIKTASELDQKSVMKTIELAWETDFPDDCDCSDDLLPNTIDQRAASAPPESSC